MNSFRCCVVALASSALACGHGLMFRPTVSYPGETLPDARIATVGVQQGYISPKAGTLATIDGREWFAAVDAVDGKDCTFGCTSVVQLLPGKHTFKVKLKSRPMVTSGYGMGVTWKETPPFTFEPDDMLEQGAVYALLPAVTPDHKPSAKLKRLCESSDHVDTVAGFVLSGVIRSCKAGAEERRD